MSDQRTMLAMLAAIAECGIRNLGGTPAPRAFDHARHPARRIPLEEGLEPWHRLEDLAGGQIIGPWLTRGPGLASYHHLGVAFASAPHLLGAVQVFGRYFPYLCQAEHVFEYSQDGRTVLGWDESADAAPTALRDFLFAELLAALRSYAWCPVDPQRVEIHGCRADVDAYRNAFGCPVQTGAARSRIVLETASLAVSLRGTNPDLHHQVSLRLAADEGAARSMARRVVGTLEQLLDRREPYIEAVARHLGISVRALQHQLGREGYRYSDLLRRVRQRRALHLLCETAVPIRSVAYALGYADSGSFQRAFREWFGLRPGSFRRLHCER